MTAAERGDAPVGRLRRPQVIAKSLASRPHQPIDIQGIIAKV